MHYNEQDVLERADLVAVLLNSGRVGVLDEGSEGGSEEEKDMDVDGGEGKEEGKEEEKVIAIDDEDGVKMDTKISGEISREEVSDCLYCSCR